MANKTVAQPQNAEGGEGYTGFSNVQEVSGDIPENYQASIVYKNKRGQFVDPYGRRVEGLGTNQAAGQVGTDEQSSTTQYNQPDETTEGDTEDENQ